MELDSSLSTEFCDKLDDPTHSDHSCVNVCTKGSQDDLSYRVFENITNCSIASLSSQMPDDVQSPSNTTNDATLYNLGNSDMRRVNNCDENLFMFVDQSDSNLSSAMLFNNEPETASHGGFKPRKRLCANCSTSYHPVTLQLCQFNFEQAMYICPQDNCQYPLFEEDLTPFIIHHNVFEAVNSRRRKRKKTKRSSHNEKKKRLMLESHHAQLDDDLVDLPSILPFTSSLTNDPNIPYYDGVTEQDAKMILDSLTSTPENTSSDYSGNDVTDQTLTPETGLTFQSNRKMNIFHSEEIQPVIEELPVMESTLPSEAHFSVPNDDPILQEQNLLDEICQSMDVDFMTDNDIRVKDNKLENSVILNEPAVHASIEDSTSMTTSMILEATTTNKEQEVQNVTDVSVVSSTVGLNLPEDSNANLTIETVASNVVENIETDDKATSLLQTSIESVKNIEICRKPEEKVEQFPKLFQTAFHNVKDIEKCTTPEEINSGESLKELSLPPKYKSNIQWQNKQNSCWLDSILTAIMFSVNIRASINCNMGEYAMFHRLCSVYDVCQQRHNNIAAGDDISQIFSKLNKARTRVLDLLLLKLPSLKPGAHESCFELFPNILKLESLSHLFSLTLRWEFECDECEYKNVRRVTTNLVSFPSTTPDFHPLNATFPRSCFSCSAPDQVMTMVMEKIPPCIMLHFEHGLPHNRFKVLDFGIQGHLYSVTAVIQYITSPFNHFILWVRDCKANRWLCCDDLKPISVWQTRPPKIPPREIHMVLWEKQGLTMIETPANPTTDTRPSHLQQFENEEAILLGEEIPAELFSQEQPMETIVVEDTEDPTSSSQDEEPKYDATRSTESKTPKSPLKTEQKFIKPKLDAPEDISNNIERGGVLNEKIEDKKEPGSSSLFEDSIFSIASTISSEDANSGHSSSIQSENMEEYDESLEEPHASKEEPAACVEEPEKIVERLPESIKEPPESIKEIFESNATENICDNIDHSAVLNEKNEEIKETRASPLPNFENSIFSIISTISSEDANSGHSSSIQSENMEEYDEIVEEPHASEEEPVEIVKEPAEGVEEPKSTEEPFESLEELPESAEELPESAEELPESVEEPSEIVEEPPESVEEPQKVVERLSESVEEPSKGMKEIFKSNATEDICDDIERGAVLNEKIEDKNETRSSPLPMNEHSIFSIGSTISSEDANSVHSSSFQSESMEEYVESEEEPAEGVEEPKSTEEPSESLEKLFERVEKPSEGMKETIESNVTEDICDNIEHSAVLNEKIEDIKETRASPLLMFEHSIFSIGSTTSSEDVNSVHSSSIQSENMEEPAEIVEEPKSMEEPFESVEESSESVEELPVSVEEPAGSMEESPESEEEPHERMEATPESLGECSESEEDCTESKEQPPKIVERLPRSVVEPPESMKEPFKSTEESTECVEVPSENMEELSESVEEPSESVEEPSSPDSVKEPHERMEELPEIVGEPPKRVEEPAGLVKKPSESVKEPLGNVEEPSEILEQPSESLKEPLSSSIPTKVDRDQDVSLDVIKEDNKVKMFSLSDELTMSSDESDEERQEETVPLPQDLPGEDVVLPSLDVSKEKKRIVIASVVVSRDNLASSDEQVLCKDKNENKPRDSEVDPQDTSSDEDMTCTCSNDQLSNVSLINMKKQEGKCPNAKYRVKKAEDCSQIPTMAQLTSLTVAHEAFLRASQLGIPVPNVSMSPEHSPPPQCKIHSMEIGNVISPPDLTIISEPVKKKDKSGIRNINYKALKEMEDIVLPVSSASDSDYSNELQKLAQTTSSNPPKRQSPFFSSKLPPPNPQTLPARIVMLPVDVCPQSQPVTEGVRTEPPPVLLSSASRNGLIEKPMKHYNSVDFLKLKSGFAPSNSNLLSNSRTQFESYKPKRSFKLAGYKKANLKRRKSDIAHKPYQNIRSKENTKPTRSQTPLPIPSVLETVDKTSEHSDISDLLGDVDSYSHSSGATSTSIGSETRAPWTSSSCTSSQYPTPTGSLSGSSTPRNCSPAPFVRYSGIKSSKPDGLDDLIHDLELDSPDSVNNIDGDTFSLNSVGDGGNNEQFDILSFLEM
ncbi:uncharacterized protein LOC100179148 [Ciona intestinalis]